MRVIIDTDMGMGSLGTELDDGFALALALAEPALTVEAITTVNGNTDVERATILTKNLLPRLGGRTDIPIHRGAATPLLHPETYVPVTEEFVIEQGQDAETGTFAAHEIARLALESPGEITLIAIGPLTNVAAAFNLDPRVAGLLKEVVIMGGVYRQYTHRREMPGEFNFWKDPDAARAVMRSGAKLRLVGLDVTLQVKLTRKHAERMLASKSPTSQFMAVQTFAWLDHWATQREGQHGSADWCAMHDPLTIAVLTRPELLTFAQAHVDVITNDPAAAGLCVTDFFEGAEPTAGEVNAEVAIDVDADAFMDYFLQRIETF